MDRERLKEVHQTDLTESRVNEDFVDWLKNKGPTWLLVVLAAVCVYLAVVRYKQHKISKVNEGWAAYFMAELPGAYEDVARDFPDVGELANAARLSAADRLMRSVQTGLALGAVDPTTGIPAAEDLLAPEERTQFLARADGLYGTVLEADDGSAGRTLFAVQAMNGKAAVAEARQDLPGAGAWYAKAAQRAEAQYPGLAEQARRRAESTPGLEAALTFRAAAEVGQERPTPPRRDPVVVDPTLRGLIMPDESGG